VDLNGWIIKMDYTSFLFDLVFKSNIPINYISDGNMEKIIMDKEVKFFPHGYICTFFRECHAENHSLLISKLFAAGIFRKFPDVQRLR